MASRDEFPAFPFDPYPVQLRFMKEVYAALQKGGIAIAESPTGESRTLPML
jgi:chromosome transmission fidelity protein 1